MGRRGTGRKWLTDETMMQRGCGRQREVRIGEREEEDATMRGGEYGVEEKIRRDKEEG